MTKCTHCTDGTVASWHDPEDGDRCYPGIDLLPDEVIARLIEGTAPCPVCGGSMEVHKIVRITREVRLSQGSRPADAPGRMRGNRPHRGLRRLHRVGGPRREADEAGEVERGPLRPGQFPSPAARRYGRGRKSRWTTGPTLRPIPRVAFVANPESGGMSLDPGGIPHGGLLEQFLEARISRPVGGSNPP